MPLFLLIRHGENDYVKKGRLAGRTPGVHLNTRGQQQSRALVETLAGAPLKAIYSSPLERALETAGPLAAACGLEVCTLPGLTELDPGEWQGKTLKALRRLKLWRVVQGAPSRMRFPGGESFVEAQQRIVRELEQLCARHDAQDLVACVSHADPIKLAVAFYLGLPIDLFQRLAVSPASITALHLGESGSQLVTLNYDPSFSLKPPEKKEKENREKRAVNQE
jgi:probable phosphomutase (TIGR03848 family)